MTRMPSRLLLAAVLLVLGSWLFPTSAATMTAEAFRAEYIRNYEARAYDAQAKLVKAHPALVPGVIQSLATDAMQSERGFESRMSLLNIASSLAYMHRHWNGDDKPLQALEPIIKAELEQEQQRVARIMKWKKEESILGNFVMKQHDKEMTEKGVSPVLYPHWMHRAIFDCKVCHESIFHMQRWSNPISHKEIDAGRQCGACHDGKLAFSSTEKCERCHIVGRPEAEALHHPEKVDLNKLKQAAERVGAKWNPEKLPNGKLPLDRFNFIDWLALKNAGAFSPLVSLDPNVKDETRDNRILFKSSSDFVSDVIFDHKVHADWINCITCHPAIFKDELGGNRIKMIDMASGQFCGHCHGKVSFTFADCLRCHKKTTGKVGDHETRFSNLLHRPAP